MDWNLFFTIFNYALVGLIVFVLFIVISTFLKRRK